MQRQSLNQGWQFHLGALKGAFWQAPDLTEGWQPVDLPHDWSIGLERAAENPSSNSGGYFPTGTGWYAKTLDAPEAWRGRQVFIEFEGVYMNAEVWLNEHYLGRHPYGYTSFLVDLTPYLKLDQPNLLRVSVDNACQLNSRWYSGSGIYRPATLLVAGPVHLAHWGVYVTTPQVTAEQATVRAETTVWNRGSAAQPVSLHSRVSGSDGAILADHTATTDVRPGKSHVFSADLALSAPRLWSPDDPVLYRLETEVIVDGQIVDTAATPFGIRTVAFSAEHGFLLNGKPLKLKGDCVHHDNGVLGAASYGRAEERKVALHKASGYNAIRCAHNPPAPSFLDACDRLGMLVIDEAFDCWQQGKNPYDYHVVFDDWWQRDIASMVRRDRNHPSVILWSIGNEVLERDGRSNGVAVAQMLAGEVRRLDPTRPITAALCNVWGQERTWRDTDPVFAVLDVGGYNYQWREYRSDHERVPERVMIGTETIPAEAFESWREVEELPYVVGDFVWTSLDYLGESGIGRVHFDPDNKSFLGEFPWHQANCGDLDLCGFKRPQSYYRDMLWGTGEKLYIAVHVPLPDGRTPVITYWGWPDVVSTWTWPGHEGQVLKIDVYSACDEVELFLNGRSVGVQPSGSAQRRTATFEVPYEPGELRAMGRSAGQVAQVARQTAAQPAALRLSADRTALSATPDDLAYLTVEIADAAGTVHPFADRPVRFTVEGAGILLAVGSADPVSTEPYVSNVRTTHRGRALAVVRTSGAPGEIRMTAEADGLTPATVTLMVSA
jgi:beta-galactosidase